MRLNLSRSELAKSHDFVYNLWVKTTNKGLEGEDDNTEGGEGEDIKRVTPHVELTVVMGWGCGYELHVFVLVEVVEV